MPTEDPGMCELTALIFLDREGVVSPEYRSETDDFCPGWDETRQLFVCGYEGCDETFPKAPQLIAHQHNWHKQYADEVAKKADLTCRYCDKPYTRPDARVRHEKKCPQNPAVE